MFTVTIGVDLPQTTITGQAISLEEITDFLLLKNDHLWWGPIEETRLVTAGDQNYVDSVWEQRVRVLLPVYHQIRVLERRPGLMRTSAVATRESPLKLNYLAEYRIEPDETGKLYRYTLIGQIQVAIPFARWVFQPFIALTARRYLHQLRTFFQDGSYREHL